MNDRPSYKTTFLDRLGPAGMHRVSALQYGAVVFTLSAVMFSFVGHYMIGLNGIGLMAFTLMCALTLGWLSMYVGLTTGEAASRVARYVTAGGSGTPYEEQFSQEQALVMQRDYAGALALFELRIAARPGEPRARIAAADLYMTHGENPKRAAELLREVQRIPNIGTGHDVYASNKLADLYLGPLGEPGRALVEFRRLIERYPGSTAAGHAKMALANLKQDMIKDHKST
jgi:hypothetical protein